MSDPFLGEIKMFGGNYAPYGYAFCDGSSVPLNQNQALFSLLGITYGGDGVSTFALPDLRGRSPVGFGQGQGLSPIALGQSAGNESVSLSLAQLPPHSIQIPAHSASVTVSGSVGIPVSSATATVASPVGAVPAAPASSGRPFPVYGSAQSGSDTLAPFDLSLKSSVDIPAVQSQPVGEGLPLPVRTPYLGVNFIIALQGIYPSRG
ncbi:phage tail protein [Phytopseudomonas daroniae]|uniref:phage tail protein n=1 Tax=Phytopseudomonas daroniae TaxID=2487519 RepID=UPI0010385D54|nr:tail fiber protein [Pseudomonas daroniae]TBU72809.1 phage tail protein [Pseudomonas daroniae]